MSSDRRFIELNEAVITASPAADWWEGLAEAASVGVGPYTMVRGADRVRVECATFEEERALVHRVVLEGAPDSVFDLPAH